MDGQGERELRWIRVVDRLPANRERVVWLVRESPSEDVGRVAKAGRFFSFWFGGPCFRTDEAIACREECFPPNRVTHWLPLPKIPLT